MNFSDKADKKQENVKEPGELKAETVNNADGTDGTKEREDRWCVDFTFSFHFGVKMYL